MKTFILSSVIFMQALFLVGQHSDILERYIELGIDSNLALQQEELQVSQSIEDLNQARGLFLPEVTFNASYIRARGGRNILIPVGDLVNPIYQQLNALTDQQSFPTNIPNEEEQFLPDNFHDTRIELRQPLFNSEIYHNYRAKQAMIGINESKKMTYEKELIKEIKVAYYQYLRAHAVRNTYLNTKTLLDELLRVNQAMVQNHKATIDVVYRAEFEISDIVSKIAQADKQVTLAASYFNFLLNQDLDSAIEIDSNLVVPERVESELSNLEAQALSSRDELSQLSHALKAQDHLIKLQKGKKLPNVALAAQAGYQGFGYDFNQDQDYALLSLNLEIPLFTGFQNNSKVQRSRIQLRQLELEQENLKNQIRLEVIEAYRSLQAAKSSYDAQKAASRSAAKSFEIIRRKYQENLVLLVEFLDARTEYTNSQTSLAIAQYMVMIRMAELERAVSL